MPRPDLPRHLLVRLRSATEVAVDELGRAPRVDELARRAGLGRSLCRQFLRSRHGGPPLRTSSPNKGNP